MGNLNEKIDTYYKYLRKTSIKKKTIYVINMYLKSRVAKSFLILCQ